MGNKILEPTSDESQESYKIITYPGNQLPQDMRSLIIAPFLNSLRYGNDLFKLIDKNSYYSVYPKYIEALLRRDNSIIKTAALDDETILGWSLIENKTLHYIWVKKEVRRQGIGQSLLPKEFDVISHITNKGMNIWVSKYPKVRFDPFI